MFLTTTALTTPHHPESVAADENFFFYQYSVLRFIDFCNGVILFTMESVY